MTDKQILRWDDGHLLIIMIHSIVIDYKIQIISHHLFTDCLNIGKDRLIQNFTNWGKEYKIEFDITIDKLGYQYANVLQFTNANEDMVEGSRIPGVWINPPNSYIYIQNGDIGRVYPFTLNTKYHISIQQFKEDAKYFVPDKMQ